MPELPEVETTRRGIKPLITGKTVFRVTLHNPSLRWPVPECLKTLLPGQKVHDIERRSKYLLIRLEAGTLIVHLGMTGHLRVVKATSARRKHDHFEILFHDGTVLRFNDSRRFGAIFWTDKDPLQHARLMNLGPEPLSGEFNANYLYQRSRNRSLPIKPFLMDAKIVVGVGNIYASEALFRAKISPLAAAGKISKIRYQRLVKSVVDVLEESIAAGGTTIRDFMTTSGMPGYFKQELRVYGRVDQPCYVCNHSIKQIRLSQRSTFYCPRCQK
ncbi:MAG: bifunctional DNA-formamidopyrimidine glycosylase/DNA-(apurinic or apyrimidinic site) lyase [Deltaproteobacteria bacterium]|jgi:formamidopyrimidine-DNA glycosylase|nr:bifunctional DNA-formamidopyrimidine glycosylase/DNA-(apurinic or apyrimidinic site) lyase [Deltaproteobacteria bacterium]